MNVKRCKVAILLVIIGVIAVTGCREIDRPVEKASEINNDKKKAEEHLLKARELGKECPSAEMIERYKKDIESIRERKKWPIATDADIEEYNKHIEFLELKIERYERCAAANEAIAEYKKAIELDPTNPMLYKELGSAHISKYYDLRRVAGKPRVYDPADSEAIRLYGLAIENMKKALSIDPDYYWAHNELAQTYLNMGLYDEAEKHCRAVLDNEKSIMYARNEAHGFLSSIYEAQGKKEEAEKQGKIARALHESFERLISPDEGGGGHLQRGDEYFSKEKFDQAIEEYQKALESEPNNAGIYAKIGGGYLAKAKPYLKKMIERGEREEEVESSPEMKKIREFQQEGKKYLDKALSLDPEEPSAHIYMGMYHLGEQQYDKAIEEYEFVLKSERAMMFLKYLAHDGLKDIYERLGKTDEAKKEEEWLKDFEEKRKKYGDKVLMW